ncbi:MAG: hypothetical protein H0T47_06805 [Planctomycetaceae bacterium]|nr:hypothetical protein [Planctomycetaceae bacterium]
MRQALLTGILLACVIPSQAREPVFHSPFPTVKAHVAQQWDLAKTKAEKSRILQGAAATKFGSRTRTALGPMLDLDPDLSGYRKLTTLTASDNREVRKGAVRAGRVAGAFQSDGRFEVIALDERVIGDNGKMRTDRDIVLRHKATGLTGRLEVKQVTPENQAKNLSKYKRQIDQMAEEFRQTGRPQGWINKHSAHPQLRKYAETRGVKVFDNVSTSRNPSRGTMPIAAVVDQLDAGCHQLRGGEKLGIVMKAGSNLWQGFNNGERAVTEWRQVSAGSGSWRRAGRFSTSALGGTTIAASQLMKLTRFARLSKFAGRAGYLIVGVSEGFVVSEWTAGEISTRQFAYAQAEIVGGFVGGLAGGKGGAWAGAAVGGAIGGAIGSFVPVVGTAMGATIGGTIGAFGGGFGGGWIGATAATSGVDRYYSFRDAQEEKRFFEWVAAHYAKQN